MKRFRLSMDCNLYGALLFCLIGITGLAQAQAPKQDGQVPQKVITIEGITEYKFANGLRLISFPDPSASNFTLNMTVLVGSRHEGYGETGMAHLLEHMLFKGSKLFPHIDKDMQAHGAESNATTWVDRTNYFETMPASNENLEFSLKLEADRLLNSFIRREDLVKEMTVVRNEFEKGENSPEGILNQRMMAIAYEWHNYGKSTIGNRADIERVPIDNLHAFYKKYYRVDNVVLIIAGKFDEAVAIKYVTTYFGSLKAPEQPIPMTYTEEPAQDGERSVTLRRVGKGAVVGTMYHIPSASHEDAPAIEVLSMILGDSPSGRLYKALVDTKKATRVATDASSWYDPGILELTVHVNDKVTPEEVRDITIEVTEKFSKSPVTKEEVTRAISKYMSARERALTKSLSIAHELNEWVAAGDWRLLFIIRDQIAKVTPEDVQRVADKYLKSGNRTLGMFIPAQKSDRTPIPTAPPIDQVVKDYKGGKAMTTGEEFDTSPENLDKRIIRRTLSSGLKVAYLPKKTRGESVTGRITLRFGNEKSLFDSTASAGYLGTLMMRGTKKHTRQQLEDKLDELKSKLSASSGLGTLSFGLESKRDKLPQVLEMMREVLREPSFPEKEFALLKQNQKQKVEKDMVEPQALAQNSLMRELKPFPSSNIRYQPTFPEILERIEKVKLDDVVKIYKDQLSAEHGEITFVGDFDVEATTTQLESIFSNLKSSVPFARIKSEIVQGVKGKKIVLDTPDKENAVYLAGQTFELMDTDPDYAPLSLGNDVLGNGFTSRLIVRLRQEDGLSYGAGSFLRISAEDRVGSIMAYAIVNPSNMQKLDKATMEELTKIQADGITADELKRAQQGYLEEAKTERGNDGKLVSMIQSHVYLGRTFAFDAELEKKITSLSRDVVNSALSRYLDPNRLVIIHAGDFRNKKETELKK